MQHGTFCHTQDVLLCCIFHTEVDIQTNKPDTLVNVEASRVMCHVIRLGCGPRGWVQPEGRSPGPSVAAQRGGWPWPGGAVYPGGGPGPVGFGLGGGGIPGGFCPRRQTGGGIQLQWGIWPLRLWVSMCAFVIFFLFQQQNFRQNDSQRKTKGVGKFNRRLADWSR